MATAVGCEKKQSAPRVLVANLGMLSPLVYRSPGAEGTGDKLTGLEYELLQDFARWSGARLECRRITRVKDKLPGVIDDHVDLAIGAIDITTERSKKVLFSKATVVSGKAILMRVNDETAADIRSHWDLRGKPVATKKDTTSVAALKEIGATIHAEKEIESAFRMLREKKVVAVVFDAPVLWDFVKHQGKDWAEINGEVFDPVEYGIAVNLRNTQLRDEINRFLDEYLLSPKYQSLLTQFVTPEDSIRARRVNLKK